MLLVYSTTPCYKTVSNLKHAGIFQCCCKNTKILFKASLRFLYEVMQCTQFLWELIISCALLFLQSYSKLVNLLRLLSYAQPLTTILQALTSRAHAHQSAVLLTILGLNPHQLFITPTPPPSCVTKPDYFFYHTRTRPYTQTTCQFSPSCIQSICTDAQPHLSSAPSVSNWCVDGLGRLLSLHTAAQQLQTLSATPTWLWISHLTFLFQTLKGETDSYLMNCFFPIKLRHTKDHLLTIWKHFYKPLFFASLGIQAYFHVMLVCYKHIRACNVKNASGITIKMQQCFRLLLNNSLHLVLFDLAQMNSVWRSMVCFGLLWWTELYCISKWQ